MADSAGVPPESPALGPAFSLAGSSPPALTPTQASAREAILRRDRAEDYERVACPCGLTLGDRLLAEVDRHGLPTRNVICLACGLIRITPRWREERYRLFYESEYRTLYNRSLLPKARYAAEVAANPATAERAAWVQREAQRHRMGSRPRVVELGAGAGWNLAHLPPGWCRLGYDVDQDFLAIGRAEFALDMRYGLVDEALAEIAAADLVLLSHVVEHLSDPGVVLRKIGQHLPPGALVLIEVPGLFRIHRTNLDVRSYLQNAHTYTYCAATLADECHRSGLDVLSVDEEARAVCRVGQHRVEHAGATEGRAGRIVHYLQLCNAGYRHHDRLRRLPGIGRAAASLWKRTYYASLALLVPPAQTPR